MTGREWAQATAVMGTIAVLIFVLLAVTPAADGRTAAIRVCTANVQDFPDMPDRQVRADVAETRDHCDLILWQEIAEPADRRAVRTTLGAGWKTTGHANEVPISYRTRIAHKIAGTTSKTIRVSRAIPRCSDGRPSYSPARWITILRLQIAGVRHEVDLVNLHLAQTGRKGCRRPERLAAWQQAWHRINGHVDELRDQDHVVIIGGDWNRHRPDIDKMRPRQIWVTEAPHGLDHIAISGTHIRLARNSSRALHSDHPLRAATVRLG